ncbi:hypothetical protein LTA6_000175 [Microbacterium sp. LTA6]|uniref:hypothetical protein n=1 Tax=unclassified Microbacterium TaxID=2609290 RepID=UPI0031397F6D
MTWTTRTATGIRNVHRRRYSDINAAWELALRVADPSSRVWPADGWDPMLLDRGITVGSSGGHGAVRYVVSEVEDSRFRFACTMPQLEGFHEFRREGDELVHELVIQRASRVLLVALIPLHDAVLEELLDNVEDLLAGRSVPRPRNRTRWVRVLRALFPEEKDSRRARRAAPVSDVTAR